MPTDTGDRFNYPLMLNLRDRLVVLVGAGTVGQRKLVGLLRVAARVRLVDPLLADNPHRSALVESIGRAFEPEDLKGALLVFACTDSALINTQIVAEAQRRQILCCRADQSSMGDFSLPAVLRRGPLSVAVSTGGSCPALAAEIRDRLAVQVSDRWGFSLEIVSAVRRKWLTEQIDDKYNQQVLRSFWAEQLLPLIEQGRLADIDQLLTETFGEEFSLERLPLQLPEGIL